MWKDWIHPLLFGLYVPLSIYAFNNTEIAAAEVFGPIAAVVAVSMAVLAGARLARADLRIAAVGLSLFWLVFFQFATLRSLPGLGLLAERTALWVLLGIAALLTACLRRTSVSFRDAVATVLLIAGVACAPAIARIPAAVADGWDRQSASSPQTTPRDVSSPEERTAAVSRRDDDVYWILLDAYAGETTLARYFDFDNSPFLTSLEGKGFVVSRRSHANYDKTLHSLSSNLNMGYMDSYVGDYPPSHANNRPLREAIYHSRVFELVTEAGFGVSMYAASSHLMPPGDPGFIAHAESFMSTGQYSLAVIANTPLNALFKADRLFMPIDADRKPWVPASIDWVFKQGLAAAGNGRRDFVFLHVLCPHEPYYFNADCSVAEDRRNREWSDFDGDFRTFRDAYRANLACVNRKVETFLDELAVRRGTLPLVVMQGDHGPNEIDPAVIDREGFDRYLFQTEVLNAFHLPPNHRNAVTDAMTLVNTWRAVLPALGIKVTPPLANKSYATTPKKPFQLHPYDQSY